MNSTKIKKTVIFAGYQCNNQCIFCVNSKKRNMKNSDTETIFKEIKASKERGATYLEFIGGEITIRNDGLELIKYAKSLKFDTIAMATNGRIFSYYNIAKQYIEAGLTNIIFSIHGHNNKLHDSLTLAPGSFAQLMKGIKNFKKLGFANIGSNTTIVKQNYKKLPQIGKFISGLGLKNCEFIFVDPNCGGAKNNFYKIMPKISKIAPYVRKCLDIGKDKAQHWDIRYVPLCYFQDYLNQVSELKEVKTFQTEHIAQDFVNFSVESNRSIAGRHKTEKCRQCSLFDKCEGIWVEYLKNYGDTELKPIK